MSGPGAKHGHTLKDFGLDVRFMDAPVGAASAVKMCYGGITKGFTALAATIMRASAEAGVDEYIKKELVATQPGFWKFLEGMMPNTYDKAFRFAPEMREIAEFVQPDRAGSAIFEAFAVAYEQMAADRAGANIEIKKLEKFFA
jgi:3-hydroxyisobutyrate dehydrogenase-like beta-hydroxyacid dehydrogenase